MIAQNPKERLFPEYKIPIQLWWGVLCSAVLRKQRSVLADSRAAFADGRPKTEWVGLENIPATEACVVVCNHYNRPGFQAWWIALGISAAFSGQRKPDADADVRWVMTSAWTFPDHPWRARLLTPITRWLFTRIADCYGFVNMPPMPPALHEVQVRARAVLKTIRLATKHRRRGILIGLAPEGRDIESGFGSFPEGAGEFIALLVQTGLKVLPAGVYEQGGTLKVHFGKDFTPLMPVEKKERDRLVIEQVKDQINSLLP